MKTKNLLLGITVVALIFCSIGFLYFFTSFYFSDNKDPQKKETDQTEDTYSLPIVIIDAGHGGEDGGAIGNNGAYEKDINLVIAQKLNSKLKSLGIRSVLTRDSDILLYDKTSDYEGKKKKLDLLARKEFAEEYENAIFISIHQNSFPKKQYRGFQVYYSPNAPESKLLSLLIENSVKSSLQPDHTRPSKEGDSSIYLLDKLYCPSVLIECGFISNPEECSLLCQESYQNALCDSISDGIIDFLK